MKGTIRAQWRVFCNLCPRNEQINDASVNTRVEAMRMFKDKGWYRARHGLWVCPRCNEDTKRFLARSNQTAGWVKVLRKRS